MSPTVTQNQSLRSKARDIVQNLVDLSQAFGLLKPSRQRAVVSPARQKTLDIRSRVADGTPTRGSARAEGLVAKRHSKRKRLLAAATASGEPMLTRKGKLKHGSKPKPEYGEGGDIQKLAKKNRKRVQFREDPWQGRILSDMRNIQEGLS